MEEQVVGILEAVQEATPEIAAQAVACERLMNSVWIMVGLVGITVGSTVYRWLWKHWDEKDYLSPAILFGFILGFSLLATTCATGDLIGSYIAPDYYAAEAVVRLLRGGL